MLAILVTLRGRPWNVKKFIGEYKLSNAGASELLFSIDKNDPHREKLLEEIKGYRYMEGEWAGVSQKSNAMYEHFKDDKFLAYMGGADDITYSPAFDKIVLDEINYLETRTGHRCWVLYGNDMVHGQRLCTHWISTKEYVEARGEFTPTKYMYHQYADTVNWSIGMNCGILHYMPWVVTHHHSWANGEAPKDENYELAYGKERAEHDKKAYERWMNEDAPRQIDLVVASMNKQIMAAIERQKNGSN